MPPGHAESTPAREALMSTGQPDHPQPADQPPYALPYGQAPHVPQYGAATTRPYESARPRARVVIGLLWATIVAQLLMIGPQVMEIRRLRAVAAAVLSDEELTGGEIAMIGAGALLLLLVLLSVVF